ncbi:sensor histidine kinase [Propionispira raffinosivorans]|uniref:sensor histidine kinase n=1 Tax=Propionispira raffinosivorans TaxID=86959 RepID=UPI00037B40F3|nr:sensor histidine kinase [Propionispira raffinosivorans]
MKIKSAKFREKINSFSLYYKINILVIGMIVLSGIVISIIMLNATSHLLGTQLDKRGIDIGNSIAALSSNDILIENYFDISDRLNKTKNNNAEVRYILITDSSGRILASTLGNSLPKGLANVRLPVAEELSVQYGNELWIKNLHSNEGEIREILFPIEEGNIGFVRIGLSEKIMQGLLAENIKEIILTVLFVSFLAAIGATRLSYLIVKPLRVLLESSHRIQQGDYNVRIKGQNADEIGNLARAFNAMAHSLRKKNRENYRLLKEVQAKEEMRVSLIRNLFTVQEDEQRRLSRELHDETGQCMVSLLAYIKVLHSKMTTAEQKKLLADARTVTVNVLERIRIMAVELRPPELDYLGLVAAMEKYIINFNNQNSLNVEFTPPLEKLNMSNNTAVSLYRILQESMTNIVMHANAHNVYIMIKKVDSSIYMQIQDDGQGMGENAVEIARGKNRLGLFGMQERAELLDGVLNIDSTPGNGTKITVILPIGSEEC